MRRREAAAARRAFEVKRFCEVRHRSGEKGDEDDSWWQLHAVFETLAEQLHWGVKVELEPLMRGGLGAMDIDVAATLYKGGIRKVDDLAHATAKKLQEVLSSTAAARCRGGGSRRSRIRSSSGEERHPSI